MQAVGYIRVSTDEQAKEGISLDAQEEKIRAFSYAKDWDLVGIYNDAGYSGKSLNRPEMQRLISDVKTNKFDVIIIYKLDRLTRKVKDLGYLIEEVFEKNKVAFTSVSDNFDTTTANGKLILNILGSVAQWERDIISERTKDALMYKKSQNKAYSPIPYGYDRQGDNLLVNTKEIAIINYMHMLKENGLSYRKIADTLNRENIETKNGKFWTHRQVGNIIFRGTKGTVVPK